MNELSLSKWLRQDPTQEELFSAFHSVYREESPRSAALGAAAMLEVGLTSALVCRLWLPDDETYKEILGNQAPLGTFSNKIRMAEAMRVIGPVTRANLDRIREIRNAFAHTARNLTFETHAVAQICEKITLQVWPWRPRRPYIKGPRDKYVCAALGLFIVFEQQAKHTRTGASVQWDNYPVRDWWYDKYPNPLP